MTIKEHNIVLINRLRAELTKTGDFSISQCMSVLNELERLNLSLHEVHSPPKRDVEPIRSGEGVSER